MATLDQLMELPGAVAAVSFNESGEVSDFRGDLTDDLASMAGQMCSANMAIFRMQADGWSRLTGQTGFMPEKGFAFMGLDYAVAAMDGQAVFLRKSDADFDRAFQVLEG
jgi:roadblock/LC7 domain-containing protein